jgi:hypothetical protein
MCGHDLINAQTEMGVLQSKHFKDLTYSDNESGKMMILNVKYIHLGSGLSKPPLENPWVYISYLTPTWTTALRQFLLQHNHQNTLTDTLRILHRGQHDQCTMNPTALTRYTHWQQRDLNLVRIYLQVIT